MSKIFTPFVGKKVIDPVSKKPVPERGLKIPPQNMSYFARRQMDGDGVISDEEVPVKEKSVVQKKSAPEKHKKSAEVIQDMAMPADAIEEKIGGNKK